MSSIENPRPLSRRTMLTGLTAAVSASGAIIAPVLAASADPIFALAAAERRPGMRSTRAAPSSPRLRRPSGRAPGRESLGC